MVSRETGRVPVVSVTKEIRRQGRHVFTHRHCTVTPQSRDRFHGSGSGIQGGRSDRRKRPALINSLIFSVRRCGFNNHIFASEAINKTTFFLHTLMFTGVLSVVYSLNNDINLSLLITVLYKSIIKLSI